MNTGREVGQVNIFCEIEKPAIYQERKPTVVNGYAMKPGTGPQGETCGSCKHRFVKRMAGTYHKCLITRRNWTGGAGTDIRVRSPACQRWEPIEDINERRIKNDYC